MKKEITGADRANAGIIQKQTAIFSWKDVVYDIKIKKEPRRILDHVDGWVKPGTLTALMVSCCFPLGEILKQDSRIIRAFLVLVRLPFSTCWPRELLWVWLPVKCSSTANRETCRSSERLATFSNKIFISKLAPCERPSGSALSFDSPTLLASRRNMSMWKKF